MGQFLTFFIVLISYNLYASEMKPGLWEVKMKIFSDGKEFDPMAEVKKQLEKMPPEQRKMILDGMAKESGAKNNLSEVCYTKEMLKDPQKIGSEEDKDCKYVVKSQTSRKVVSTFKCVDGISGTSVWELKDPNNMRVNIDSKDKKGKTGKMEYSAKFLRAKCNS